MFGYIAAGYTTLACYMLYAVAHYLGMKKIMKENMPDVRVYDMKFIVGISALFLVAAGIVMFTYDKLIIRYCIIVVSLIIAFVKRKMIIGAFKGI